MTKIILAHGMNGTKESWNTLPGLLVNAGYNVEAVDLPGHQTDLTLWDLMDSGQYNSGLSMDDYIASVVTAFPSGSARDVVLIGHSMGGAVISQVAAHHSDRIRALVYIAAMLPDDSQSPKDIIQEIKQENIPPLRTMGDFLPHVLSLRLVKQPAEPLAAEFNRTADFDALSRGYVLCKGDDVIPPAIQRKMLSVYDTVVPATRVVEMTSSHFPQFDDPGGLFAKVTELLND